MTKIETYIVNSFTDEPFKGNPAGVCLLDEDISDQFKLQIAKELGLSETAFLLPMNETQTYDIRFFSPKMEIPLCGHATLASAKVMFNKHPSQSTFTFKNIEGLALKVSQLTDGIQMNFPIYDTIPQEVPAEVLDALGIDQILNSTYNKETHILLLEISSSQVLRRLQPHYNRLIASHSNINGVLVTALSDDKNFDFESRYFWPWSGTNEDPVTGGTHTFLAKYWGERLNKKRMNSYQCSERSGFMTVELIDHNLMTITSNAQIVFEGSLQI